MPAGAQEVAVSGRTLRLTHLDRVLYPDGTTKADVVRYYVGIAEAILPHLRGRPLVLRRWPEGVEATPFFAKRLPKGAPEWIRTAPIPTDDADPIDAPLIEDAAGLAWVGNLAALELHAPLWRTPRPDRPTHVVLDLDPGPPAGLAEAAGAALAVREVLDAAGLVAGIKASGGKGIHVLVPTGGALDATAARAFARGLAELLAKREPKRIVSGMAKVERTGKVLVDWNQNDPKRTMIAPWSLRGRAPGPRVALPVAWADVEAAAAGDIGRIVATPDEALARFAATGDPLVALGEPEQGFPGG